MQHKQSWPPPVQYGILGDGVQVWLSALATTCLGTLAITEDYWSTEFHVGSQMASGRTCLLDLLQPTAHR
jgi:hypothetical protein